MRLLFLSNTRGNRNQAVYSVIRSWLPEDNRIGYIPSTPDPARGHFKEVEAFFKGITPSYMMDYIDIHNRAEEADRLQRQLRECDAIYLSGGNTFRFLKAIMDSGLDLLLEKLAGEKVFIGTSAGGLIMTPDIEIASGENDIGLENTNGLAMVEFGFYPHFIPGDT
ncbi:MAG: Type 1 glutamine amidotransferase-like domain-containing protein, partial [Dehalococcoidales bacterium]